MLHTDGMWLVRTTIDRFNPLTPRHTVYAPAPDPQECIEVYDDAAGSGKNYVYKMRGVTDEGSERACFFVSFGSPMEVSEPYVEIAAVGSYALTVHPKNESRGPRTAPWAFGSHTIIRPTEGDGEHGADTGR